MSDDAQEWRWVGEDGVEKAVTEQELIAELSSESLPNYIFVWKKRWLEWLPAMQVAELGWALPPGKANRALKPRESSSGVQPPPPPLYRYPVIKRRAASLRGDTPPAAPASAGEATSPAERFHETSPTLSRPLEEVEMEAIASSSPFASTDSDARALGSDPATAVRDSDLTIDGEGSFTGLEAPRLAFGATSYAEDDDGDTHVLSSRPPPPGPIYVGPHSPPPSEAPGPIYDENEIPRIPRPPASPSDLSAYARFSPLDGELPDAPTLPPRSRKVALAAGAAAVGIVAALLLIKGLSGGRGGEAGEAASAAPSGPEPRASNQAPGGASAARKPDEPPPPGPPCTITTPALRVAGWAEPLVTPTLAAIPGSGRLAVGFSQSSTYAIGITIDPRTLDRDQVFREFRREKLVSVVPTSGSGKLRFEIVREGFTLTSARTVDAPTPFSIGATPFSIARLTNKAEPEPIWPLAETDQTTVPRVTPVPGGYAVAFRHGGKNGIVSIGYVDAAGAKRTELADVRGEGALTGTPSLAASDDAVLVAFAARPSQSVPWAVVAGAAKLGETPRKAARLRLRRGGPGGDRMSPAIGALGGGRWLVQWTEGSAGNRMARAQVFGADLAPRSEAINLSPDGANAGQGVVWTSGDLATILFFVRNDKNNNELWGISLECPR